MHLRGSRNILVKLIIRSSVYWQLFIFFFFFFSSVWFVLKRRKVPQAWGLTLLWKCLEVLLCTFLGLSQTTVLEENLFKEESCLAVMQHSGRAVSDEGGIALQEADTSCHQFLPANGCIGNIIYVIINKWVVLEGRWSFWLLCKRSHASEGCTACIAETCFQRGRCAFIQKPISWIPMSYLLYGFLWKKPTAAPSSLHRLG